MSDPITFPTRGEFREWLEGMPGEARAGLAKIPSCCPIACNLRDRGALAPAVITGAAVGRWRPDFDSVEEMLPTWANTVADNVDKYRKTGSIVTASECLSILAGVADE